MKTSGRVHLGNAIEHIAKKIAKKSDCTSCQPKPRRTTSSARRLQRDLHQEARDHTQSLMESEAYGVSSLERKRIETLFGEAMHILSLVRLRPRGLTGARDEFPMTATVQKLKRRARHSAIPPPRSVIA